MASRTIRSRIRTSASALAAGALLTAASPVSAQGMPETAALLVPTTRTLPAGSVAFGLAPFVSRGTTVSTPISLVLGLAPTVEVGAELDDLAATAAIGDTSALHGALKWRLIDAWHLRLALAALASQPLATGGTSDYGGGVRIGWEGLRSAVTVSADRWRSGASQLGFAAERLVGGALTVGVEGVRDQDAAARAALSLRRAFGAWVTVAVGGGVRVTGGRSEPMAIVAVGVVPRNAFLVARERRVRAPDSALAPVDTRRMIPDFEAALAVDRAEIAAARARDSLDGDRMVTPLPIGPLSASRSLMSVTWQWDPGADSIPSAPDIERLAAVIAALRCPEGLRAQVGFGDGVPAGAETGLFRTLGLLGIPTDRIAVQAAVRQPAALVVTIQAPRAC